MDSLDDYQIPYGLMAEFDTPADAMHAAEQVRDAGFTRWDVHTPYPVHGMDDMGLGNSRSAGSLSVVAFVDSLVACL